MRRLAVLQASAIAGDKARNLETIRQAAAAAGSAGSDCLTVPEMFLTGYNIGMRVRDLAETADGPSIAALSVIAKAAGCAIVAGFPERAGGKIYNSCVFVSARGEPLRVYRKMYLFGAEEPKLFAAGHERAIVEFGGANIGLAICYDIEMPEYMSALARDGASIVLAPAANMTPYFDAPTAIARKHAAENNITIVYANHCGVDSDLTYTGLSAIIGPGGEDLARAGGTGAALLIADLPS